MVLRISHHVDSAGYFTDDDSRLRVRRVSKLNVQVAVCFNLHSDNAACKSEPLVFVLPTQPSISDRDDMTLITLPTSGTIIDLDSVSFVETTKSTNVGFVETTKSTNVGNGIKITVAGGQHSLWLHDAREFLAELSSKHSVNVDRLAMRVPV
jgi:hypothetical protein